MIIMFHDSSFDVPLKPTVILAHILIEQRKNTHDWRNVGGHIPAVGMRSDFELHDLLTASLIPSTTRWIG